MKFLNKKCGIVWGAALAATAMATTAFLCPASATAATVDEPVFGKLGISYTAGPHKKLESKDKTRWTDIGVQHLYLSSQAKTPTGQKSGATGWEKHRIWDSSEELYGPSGVKLTALPISVQERGTLITSGCKTPATCTLIGTKDDGATYDLLASFVTGRQPANPLIAERLPVTLQDHFYEFMLRPESLRYKDKDNSQYVAVTETAPQGKRDNLLGLLSELGVTLNDWKQDFSKQNEDAPKVAASDLSVSAMRNGANATDNFYSGKMGVYDVMLEAKSSADKDKDVPFGKHASLTLTVMVGNPREAARKEIWDKLQLVKQKVSDKSDLPTLSDEERDALVGEADNAAEKAHDAVKEATVKAIETELSKGLKALDAVVTKAELTNAKHIASQRVKDAQKKAEEAIVRLEDLGESERNARVKEIDAKATSALEAISRATSSAEAHKHADEGVKDINNLLLFILKVWGKATILVYGGENGPARKNLNALLKPGGGLTQLQIDEYVKRIQTLVDLVTRNGGSIDLATSVDGVLEAVRQAKSGIDDIVSEAQQASSDALKSLEQAKAEAEVELRQIADGAKDKIAKIAGVGQGEKDAANDKIEAALKTALTAVDQADTVGDVRKAVDDGRNAIEKILMDLENLAKKHGKPAADKPTADKPAAGKPAALAATGVAVTDMALFVALLAMLAAVGAAVTRRRR